MKFGEPKQQYDSMVSPVVGIALLVAIAVILSTLVLVASTQFLGQEQSATAGTSIDHQSESVITVQLNNIQNADTVYVKTALGTEYELQSVGDTARILNIESEGEMAVIAEKDGKRTVVQNIEPHSFDPDYTVGGENQDFTSVQAAIDEATSNSESDEIIAVKKGTYQTDGITVTDGIKVVGEEGTTIQDTGVNTGVSTVTVEDGSTFSNIRVESSKTTTISATGDSKLVDVETPDSTSISLDDSSVKTTGNELLQPDNAGVSTGSKSIVSKTTTEDTQTIINRYTSNSPRFIVQSDKITSMDMDVVLYQPTQFFGLNFEFYEDGKWKGAVSKRNQYNGDERQVTFRIEGENSGTVIDATRDNQAKDTVHLEYSNGVMKMYHQGQLIDSKEIGDLDAIRFHPDDSTQWVEVGGTITTQTTEYNLDGYTKGEIQYKNYDTSNVFNGAPANKEEMDTMFSQLDKSNRNCKQTVSKVNFGSGEHPCYSDDYFATHYQFTFVPTETGTYTFDTASDDASDVLVNGEKVTSWYGAHATNNACNGKEGTVELTKGEPVTITYRMEEESGGEASNLCITPPSGGEQVVTTGNFPGQIFLEK